MERAGASPSAPAVMAKRGQRAREHRRGARDRARHPGVLDAVRALRQGIRSRASCRFARARSAVSRARSHRGRSGPPRATDREPDRDAPRRRVAGGIGCGIRPLRAPQWPAARDVVRDLLGDAIFQRLLEVGSRAESFRRAARRIRAPRPACARVDGGTTVGSLAAAAGHRGDGAPVLQHGVRARRDRRRAARRWTHCVKRSARRATRAARYRPTGMACTRAIGRLSHSVRHSTRRTRSPPSSRSTPLASLATRQILEPREESRLRGTIEALTEVVDEVSAAVRSQYEANPYPRWLRIERDVAQSSVADFLRGQFPHADLAGVTDAPARILVAGCGTGRHPIGTARRFPDSSVLAVDLSLASLAYAMRKTRELGIRNIDYRQADILAHGRACPNASTSSTAPACCITSRIRSRAGASSARCCAQAA